MAREQLEQLQKLISDNGLGYYLVLTQDAHNSEYVSPADKRREFISGFTGSAGTAIIGQDSYAELATDGRYWLQAESQLGKAWTLRKEGSAGVSPWDKAISARALDEGVAIGVDPRLISYDQARKILDSGADLRPIEPNLLDIVWGVKRPPEPASEVFELPTTVTGQSVDSKLADLRHELKPAHADGIVLSALDQIAWVLNLRGSDIAYNPVFKSYLLVTQNEARLYLSSNREKPSFGANIDTCPYDDIFDDLRRLASEGKRIWVPPKSSWALVNAAGPSAVLRRESPVELAKAVKNATEIAGARKAQLYCGLSVVRLLSWLQQQLDNKQIVTEYEASLKLLQLREELPEFRGLSFETISSSGPNAAIIHYSPSAEGSRIVSPNEVYLLDSGSQFTYGTTDTTRTAWFGQDIPQEVKEAYTCVLKGHIALATAVFPQGTSGYQLDPYARRYLWHYGLDYAHGTGHGVGSFLNVHEGPIGIGSNHDRASSELHVGNLISNEPGFYKDGHFGVRLESLIVVKPANTKHKIGREFLQFETITLVPFDTRLIDLDLLDADDLLWINEYHARVRQELEPHLSGADRDYLLRHTEPLIKTKKIEIGA